LGTSRGISQPLEDIAAAPDLHFNIYQAEPLPYAASPHIAFKLRVTTESPYRLHSVILRCQLQLDVSRRRYQVQEQDRLNDVFGKPDQWAQTVRSMLWTNLSVIVPSFTQAVDVEIPVPCTFDFNVTATKYFAALEDGDVPLSFYFNGTMFYADPQSTLQVAHIPWEKEASYRMPVQVWQSMMDKYYPNSVWLRLNRDAFDRLNAFRIQHGLPTFEHAIEKGMP